MFQNPTHGRTLTAALLVASLLACGFTGCPAPPATEAPPSDAVSVEVPSTETPELANVMVAVSEPNANETVTLVWHLTRPRPLPETFEP